MDYWQDQPGSYFRAVCATPICPEAPRWLPLARGQAVRFQLLLRSHMAYVRLRSARREATRSLRQTGLIVRSVASQRLSPKLQERLAGPLRGRLQADRAAQSAHSRSADLQVFCCVGLAIGKQFTSLFGARPASNMRTRLG